MVDTNAMPAPAAGAAGAAPRFVIGRSAHGMVLALSGDWLMARGAPDLTPMRAQLAAARDAGTLRFDATALGRWDTLLPIFLLRVMRGATDAGLAVDLAGLPDGAVRLVQLAIAVPRRVEPEGRRYGPIERLGLATIAFAGAAADLAAFVGETCIAATQLARGRALVRGRDFWLAVQQAGAERAADHRPDQPAGRHDPGLRRRLAACPVRRRDLRRQPGRHRHAARDGAADGGPDHGRPHRFSLCRRARHDAGQRGDRRAAHARASRRSSSWSCRAFWPWR